MDDRPEGADAPDEASADASDGGSTPLVVLASLLWCVHLPGGLVSALLAPLSFLCSSTPDAVARVISTAYVMTTVVLVLAALIALFENRRSGDRALTWVAGAMAVQVVLFGIVTSIGGSSAGGC